MTTKFFWHANRGLIATTIDTDLSDYLKLHPALPPRGEWIPLLPGFTDIPLQDVQGLLIDRGAQDILVFRAAQPVEVLRWPGGLVYLVSTLKDCLAKYALAQRIA